MSIKKLSLPQSRSFIVTDQRLNGNCGIPDQLKLDEQGGSGMLTRATPNGDEAVEAVL